MKLSNDLKFKKNTGKSVIKSSIILMLTVLVSQCSYLGLSDSYRFTNKLDGSDKSLVFNRSEKGREISLLDTAEDKAQLWTIKPEDGDYYHIHNSLFGSKESLEVKDDEFDVLLGMTETGNDDGQLWRFSTVKGEDGDYFRINNKWLGDKKSLSHKKYEYVLLKLNNSNDSDEQLWKKVDVLNGYVRFTNKRIGDKVFLSVINDGKNSLVMDKGDYTGANWKLTSAGNDSYNFANEFAKGLSLDVVNDDKKDSVQIAKTENVSGQNWKMTPAGNGYFRLINEFTGKDKSLEAYNKTEYKLEMVDTSDKDPGQIWKMTKVSSSGK